MTFACFIDAPSLKPVAPEIVYNFSYPYSYITHTGLGFFYEEFADLGLNLASTNATRNCFSSMCSFFNGFLSFARRARLAIYTFESRMRSLVTSITIDDRNIGSMSCERKAP